MPTVALAAPLVGRVSGEETELVWPSSHGSARASSLAPIHPCAVHAAIQDDHVYELLVLLDGIRVGKNRVRELSTELLYQRLEEKGEADAPR